MAIVSLPPDARQHGSRAAYRADVRSGRQTSRNRRTQHHTTPDRASISDPSSRLQFRIGPSGLLSPSLDNRMSVEEIARPGNVVGD